MKQYYLAYSEVINIMKIQTLKALILLVIIATTLIILLSVFTGTSLFGQYAIINDFMTADEYLKLEQELTKRFELIIQLGLKLCELLVLV